MDLGALMAYYEEYGRVLAGNNPLAQYEEYEKMESRNAFLDELAIKYCGDVY